MTNDDNLIKIDEIAEGHKVIVMCGVSGSGKMFWQGDSSGKGSYDCRRMKLSGVDTVTDFQALIPKHEKRHLYGLPMK